MHHIGVRIGVSGIGISRIGVSRIGRDYRWADLIGLPSRPGMVSPRIGPDPDLAPTPAVTPIPSSSSVVF
ncbi:uncharacterized protein BDR25DRAFT_362405 [Lindgomyces ingoldianus]|uniref:Uncharacterized protein n=1 Tax=Lindgomyces ingoldianus TaxID=673940 RepID=A0ACB6QA58_9PLEO|nr:uncharacterized protein BDR25DRAFT_362405 [Lindgomyces ingoldianus]KAF2463843.1 hypothetical protein BDR25DRAFT_362405 [Lindgomyces ingoldianus]